MIERLPKAVLHEHLDGGLRVGTILEIADEEGYTDLPAWDDEALTEWFYQGRSGSLERYLEAFVHTIGVMQSAKAVARVAYESAEDLANDGVVYAEIRFDPGLCTRRGLRREDVLEAALDGFARASRDTGITVNTIATALRQKSDSTEVVKAAIPFLGRGVVAFDLAGPEKGYPPDAHLEACLLAREHGFGLTLHAGEGDGVHSMWRALALCGAQRIGHGVRIADDTDFDGSRITELGSFARRVRDHRIPLEVAITSNLHTSSYRSVEEHPFAALHAQGFNVSINTDNRLMSGVSVSHEYWLAANTFGLDEGDLGEITINAIEAGFGDWGQRRNIIDDVVRPSYGIS
ncbi:MAG: adenosine deaminase [Acidimicrobiia bacterium]|nr:MAG: adenosine deaminase [Acidimicrobiia bacterium]